MRKFAPRPPIQEKLIQKLREKTKRIFGATAGNARKECARTTFDSSRAAKWFKPIITNLRQLSGEGELCMYCSSNEPSQVEHFYPLALHPKRAMSYHNYLWTCDICNRTYKGEKFPPINYLGARILNPLNDDVWQYFFIEDKFGRLLRRFDSATKAPLPRAESTCKVVGIDRETVQIKRSRRFKILKKATEDALERFAAGKCDVKGLQEVITEQRTLPFQADVGDYFLNGPGRSREPFRRLLLAAGEAVPYSGS